MSRSHVRPKAPKYTHEFLCTDTIRVSDIYGVSIVFSIAPDAHVRSYEPMHTMLVGKPGGRAELYIGTLEDLAEVRDLAGDRCDPSDRGMCSKAYIRERYGTSPDVYEAMYEYARRVMGATVRIRGGPFAE